jgi:hypothetical protein
MIILRSPKILFLKPQKVAGTSFEIALSAYADEASVITPITANDEIIRTSLGFRGPQNYLMSFKENFLLNPLESIKNLARFKKMQKFYNHIPANLVKKRLGEKDWNQLYKISIVRNPFDMAVSRFFWTHQQTDWSPVDIEKFILKYKNKFQNNHSSYMINGQEIIDYYIRYEQIHQDITHLENIFPELKGLADVMLQIKAKGAYRPKSATTKEIFSSAPKAKELISTLCQFEIEKFNYSCP